MHMPCPRPGYTCLAAALNIVQRKKQRCHLLAPDLCIKFSSSIFRCTSSSTSGMASVCFMRSICRSLHTRPNSRCLLFCLLAFSVLTFRHGLPAVLKLCADLFELCPDPTPCIKSVLTSMPCIEDNGHCWRWLAPMLVILLSRSSGCISVLAPCCSQLPSMHA